MNKLVVGFVICFIVILASGCSELKRDLPPTGGTLDLHGTGWADPTSSYFHGKAIHAANGNMQECLKCHGVDFNGGTSGVSCIACHQSEGASLHGEEWLNPASPNFHGASIRNAHWDMTSCKTCHGFRYDGGTVRVSCLICHDKPTGPEYCTTCHGGTDNAAPPRDLDRNTSRSKRGVGAHQKHFVSASIAANLNCSDCHAVPPGLNSPGHIDSALPAEVIIISPLARTTTNDSGTTDFDAGFPVVVPSPVYSPENLTCASTYCHGNFKNGNLTFSPTWNDTTGTMAACGTCHGDVSDSNPSRRALPKNSTNGGTHPNATACSGCHAGVVDANRKIIDKSKHMNGKLNVFSQERDF